ncbi:MULTISPECIES: glutamyl-tRNA reductase [Priestia]|uniref:Glutamyl-tRNA reductase n=2 Tax=Priestia TaxID=2800373 RepID=A0AAX6NB14_PRIAR|nr:MULTISPECIES: glutamyl-tRNA reductase [Priestia]AEN87449.1 Glutamyl-tRNA reductase [Priestia megaterium WSH-002]MDU9692987.1 glutamyl-tRNA reductase [Priestia aryabhattai]MED5246882.1 glutamyl-tRNA reductase [Priestia sp. LL-8]QDZ78416.1 glutamyl-tRNA reductase [Priestia megaterium]TPF15269.1 glutamyl-tRNA reductase [Priestia megaterium]
MHIIAVGLNFRTAPVEIREKLSFNEQELASAMKTLSGQKSILENIIVSTCNRTEIYAVVDQLHTGRYYVKAFLAEWFGIDKEEFSPYLTIYENDGAIEHLYRVACGLDSMVIGETQILGQVRSSFLLAQEEETIGTVFNQLFKQAVTLAKKAHHETEIGANAVSVSYAAVELAKKIFGDLSSKHVLILGAGKMGQLAVQNLYGSGAKKVTVVNRTFEKAQELANRFSGEAKPFADLQQALSEADILISSTGANDYVVTKQMMSEAERTRKGRPLFMVDIAVPRDLDPALDELETVFLYDIDDLNGIVESNLQERQKAADEIEIMLEAEIVAFKSWLGTLGVVPVISALRQKALTIQAETMKSIDRKLPDLSDRERKVLNKHTKSIINQLLRDPILHAKELAGEKHAEESLELFMKIFNIEQEVALQKEKEEQLHPSITSHSVAYQS